MLSIYLIICVQNFILLLSLLFFRSIILCLVILLVEVGLFISSYKHFIFIIIILFVCAVSVIGCWYSTLKLRIELNYYYHHHHHHHHHHCYHFLSQVFFLPWYFSS
jgi:hypothetical protein